MFHTSPEDDRLVSAAMEQLAHDTPSSRLPNPSFIWWKAQLLRRREAERQATAPIDVGERFHVGAAVVGVAALVIGVWDHVPAIGMSTPTTVALAFGAVVLLSVVAVATWDVLRH
ncbi:MAG: hypothetical protein U0Q11_12005 [Vicinamibacterales bacterium]